MSFALARPAKQGAYKEEHQRRGTEQGRFSGLVHVKAWKGGEGHGQGMFEVWWKETKCEKHKTQQSGGHVDT